MSELISRDEQLHGELGEAGRIIVVAGCPLRDCKAEITGSLAKAISPLLPSAICCPVTPRKCRRNLGLCARKGGRV
jgi:hypothetical protein